MLLNILTVFLIYIVSSISAQNCSVCPTTRNIGSNRSTQDDCNAIEMQMQQCVASQTACLQFYPCITGVLGLLLTAWEDQLYTLNGALGSGNNTQPLREQTCNCLAQLWNTYQLPPLLNGTANTCFDFGIWNTALQFWITPWMSLLLPFQNSAQSLMANIIRFLPLISENCQTVLTDIRSILNFFPTLLSLAASIEKLS